MDNPKDKQQEKIFKTLGFMLATPVLAVGVWSILVTLIFPNSGLLRILLLAIGTLIAVGVVLTIAGNVAKAFRHFFANVSDIAENGLPADNLPKKMGSNEKLNEIMSSINEMAVSYAKILSSINRATDELEQVSGSFTELFDNMTQAEEGVSSNVNLISSNIISETERMQEMNGSIGDIGDEIEHISSHVESLTTSAGSMQEYNHSVQNYIEELIQLNEENSQSIEKVREQTELTNKSAMNIQSATELIASISNQTNLLALNASIEAARAGEAGRGFAVVAEEIRKLADQSRASTEKINESVNDLIGNAQFSVEVTQKVTSAFAEQTDKIQSTSSLFGSLRQEVDHVADFIKDIEGEIQSLDSNKDRIQAEVKQITEFSNENEASAKTTLENVYSFEQIISECKDAKERIGAVSKDLVSNIGKVSGLGM